MVQLSFHLKVIKPSDFSPLRLPYLVLGYFSKISIEIVKMKMVKWICSSTSSIFQWQPHKFLPTHKKQNKLQWSFGPRSLSGLLSVTYSALFKSSRSYLRVLWNYSLMVFQFSFLHYPHEELIEGQVGFAPVLFSDDVCRRANIRNQFSGFETRVLIICYSCTWINHPTSTHKA